MDGMERGIGVITLCVFLPGCLGPAWAVGQAEAMQVSDEVKEERRDDDFN